MIEHILTYTAPAAYALLPPALKSTGATAFVLAAGLQESQFYHRRQMGGGPARSLWQFERGGLRGVMEHRKSQPMMLSVLSALRIPLTVDDCFAAIEFNDTLGFAAARLLIYTIPRPIPTRNDPNEGWSQYSGVHGWFPGDPKRATWDGNFERAWDLVAP